MAYERIDKPKGLLYHYTKRENVESILRDGRIRKFKDSECWFCTFAGGYLAINGTDGNAGGEVIL